MKNVRDWISDNPKTFAGICTALLTITIVITATFSIAAYVIPVIFAIVFLVLSVQLLYTVILALIEEFLC